MEARKITNYTDAEWKSTKNIQKRDTCRTSIDQNDRYILM